ncbi:MAG: DUF1517 domain-containing protein [Leptolyngbyaceae cyanobacterium SM1_4_3]|nr:DUF1517 domain-containing protein [Leptolyngbyaceae cyanobacterium SM1_4_3]NJN91976.1 DUF1517 domain-containing protein [Leptolyngbyaceae cyanobacterium SL_5_14]NJO66733.1 DUF1517 domain-containing protein [Leptolyngbyaceae cyanobacterium RM1_405_57]
MYKKLFALIKPLLKPLLIAGLALTLVFSQADGALAARGGRIGGGSFRAAPSRTYAPPSRTYAPPGGGYYPGGGFGFPFIIPFFGVGGGFGGLFSILIFISIASFLVRSFRQAQGSEDGLGYSSSPSVSVAKVQVGLLSDARTLQADFDRIAKSADTGSSEGLTQVLQETTLSLMRHPEYWVYGAAENQQARLEAAEAQFNRLALAERSKFSEETLSNVNNQLRQARESALVKAEPGGELVQSAPGEFIVVTLLVATQNKLQLPAVNNTQDLRRALSQVGAIPSEQLLAVEVLWTPQDENDTLSAEDLLTEYSDLKLI